MKPLFALAFVVIVAMLAFANHASTSTNSVVKAGPGPAPVPSCPRDCPAN
jgi:uncharacterized protein YraI